MKTIAKLLLIIILCVPAPLLAGTLPEIDVDNLFAKKKALVKDIMKLNDKESAVFWPLYDDYDKMLLDSFKRYQALIRDYLKEYENLSDKKAKEMMNELLEIKADGLKHRRAYIKKFSEKLPHKKVFQYFVLEEKIEVGFHVQIAEKLPEIE